MIVILYENGCKKQAEKTASEITHAFSRRLTVSIQSAASAKDWTEEVSWDDALIVMFKSGMFPENGASYITRYQKAREQKGLLLPIAISAAFQVPPKPANAIKALQYDVTSHGPHGRIVQRVGAMLNLRLQGRDAKFFLSHRSLDGAKIAAQLAARLTKVGYRPWLDVAKELDGETQILPGSAVQKEIDAALADASLVLLIDTPEAYKSLWVKHEIDTADGMMLPILPVCFRDSSDPAKGSRFPVLRELQRYETLPLPTKAGKSPLTSAQLDQIVHAAEEYLCEIFRRKCRVPFVVKEVFESKGYDWKELDKKKLMYRSQKDGGRITTKVLSHCSLFEQIYTPALEVFREYLKSTPWANYSLYIYDGPEILPNHILADMVKRATDDPVIVLHHQELAQLVHSHFTTLGATT